MHPYNPRTQEAEAGEFKASLGYMPLCSKAILVAKGLSSMYKVPS